MTLEHKQLNSPDYTCAHGHCTGCLDWIAHALQRSRGLMPSVVADANVEARTNKCGSPPTRGVCRNESQTQSMDVVTQHKSTATTSKIVRWGASIPRIASSSAERAKKAILRLFRHAHTQVLDRVPSVQHKHGFGDPQQRHHTRKHVIALFEWRQTPGGSYISMAHNHTLR